MKLCRITAAGAIALGVAAGASAQTEASATNPPAGPTHERASLPPIIVSATRTEQDPRSVGSAVTLVSAQDLENARVNTVLEALRQAPGVDVAQSGGPGRTASVFIRGHNSQHTLVLLDGVRLNSNTAGAYDFSNIPVNAIERIEIVRGAQGALYGSDAIGGVINIVTKRGTPGLHGAVEGAVGTDGYRSGGVSFSGGDAVGDFSAGYTWNRFNGGSAVAERLGGVEKDEWINHAFYGRLGLNALVDGRADLTLHYSDDHADLDGVNAFFLPADDRNAEQRRRNLSGRLNLSKPVTEWYTQSLGVGVANEKLTGRDPDTALNNFEIVSQSLTFSAQADFIPVENDTLSVGYDYERQYGENPAAAIDTALGIHSLFIQNHWMYRDSASVTIGVRHDSHETFGGETTYRLAGAYRVPQTGTRFHGSVGSGFRAPTLNDLFWPNTGWSLGNPNLGPETSVSFDLGVEQSFWGDRVIADVTYFRSDVQDLIQWAATGPNSWDPWMPQVVADAEIEGVETGLTLKPLSSLDVKLAYTFTDAVNAATGNQLALRPRHRCSASVTYRVLDKASVTLTGLRVGERYDDAANANRLDPYVRFDLAATFDATETLQFFGRVENLFNEDYEEVRSFGTPGRYALLGAKLRF